MAMDRSRRLQARRKRCDGIARRHGISSNRPRKSRFGGPISLFRRNGRALLHGNRVAPAFVIGAMIGDPANVTVDSSYLAAMLAGGIRVMQIQTDDPDERAPEASCFAAVVGQRLRTRDPGGAGTGTGLVAWRRRLAAIGGGYWPRYGYGWGWRLSRRLLYFGYRGPPPLYYAPPVYAAPPPAYYPSPPELCAACVCAVQRGGAGSGPDLLRRSVCLPARCPAGSQSVAAVFVPEPTMAGSLAYGRLGVWTPRRPAIRPRSRTTR